MSNLSDLVLDLNFNNIMIFFCMSMAVDCVGSIISAQLINKCMSNCEEQLLIYQSNSNLMHWKEMCH